MPPRNYLGFPQLILSYSSAMTGAANLLQHIHDVDALSRGVLRHLHESLQ